MEKVFEKIYRIVKKIPLGKVATYGEIAELTQSLKFRTQNGKIIRVTPRLVGRALHLNPDPKNIPCHRVVNKNGKLAENYAFMGWREQKRKLLIEGVLFKDKIHVDLSKSL